MGISTKNPQAGLHIDRPESANASALGVLLSASANSPYLDFVKTPGLDYSTQNAEFCMVPRWAAFSNCIFMRCELGIRRPVPLLLQNYVEDYTGLFQP